METQSNQTSQLTLINASDGDLVIFNNETGKIYVVSFTREFQGTTKKNISLNIGNETEYQVKSRLKPLIKEENIPTIIETLNEIKKNPIVIGEALLNKYNEVKYIKHIGSNTVIKVTDGRILLKTEYFYIV